MARRSLSQKWWIVLVILSAFVVGYVTIYGWYRIVQDSVRGPEPPRHYQRSTPGRAGSYVYDDGRAVVWIRGQTILAFRSSHDGRSAGERARHAVRVLNDALEAGVGEAEVGVTEDERGLPAVVFGGTTVAVVDEETARANDSAPEALADRWAESLRAALE